MSAPAILIRSATETLPASNVATHEAAAAAAAAGTAIYYVPRRFDKDSKLHVYLAHKCPGIISLRKLDYNLYQVLLALKRVIASEKLYDPQNPTVILCDESLENAIDVKALHVSEIRELVCKQFHPILNESDDSKSNESSCPNITLPQSDHLGGQPRNHASLPDLSTPTPAPNLNQNLASNGLTRCLTAPPATAAAEPARVAVAPAAMSASQDHVLPSWASNTANAVTARLNSNPNTPFDIEGKYWVKPAFLRVLRLVEGVNQSQLIFPYREVTNILSKYIMVNKDRFFDLRNIRIALVENDPLGEAFGVKAFARSQVTSLLRAQLIPYTEPAQPAPTQDDDSKEVDDKKRKRDPPSDADSSSSDEDETRHLLRQALKRQRRRSCSVSVTILNCSTSGEDSSSSGGETIYSAQGYETAAIRDEGDSSDEEDSDESRSDENVASSPIRRQEDDYDYGEENVYRVEYEIDDGSEEENAKDEAGNSAEDSDIEDVLIASAVTSLLNDIESSDFSNWADSGSEFSSDESSDFVLSDPELQGDVWKCVKCSQPNTPYMRYCHRCWEERKGWVPERANPRRRKREKETEGIPIKSHKFRNNGRDGKATGAEVDTAGADVDNAGAACSSRSIRLERSLSHPCESTSAAADSLMTQRANGLSDGDVEDGAFRESLSQTKSVESIGGSQSSIDSGFSQESQVDSGSQEFLSEENENETGKEIEFVSSRHNDDNSKRVFAQDSESEDSGNEQKRKRKTLNLDFSKRKKLSAKAELAILSRMKELPSSIHQEREHVYQMLTNSSSVFLTPDTETCSSSSGQLTRTRTMPTSTPASLCTLCCLRPKDACFIHGKISHQVCCYQCAKTVFNSRGTCPVCRRRIEKITRNICV